MHRRRAGARAGAENMMEVVEAEERMGWDWNGVLISERLATRMEKLERWCCCATDVMVGVRLGIGLGL